MKFDTTADIRDRSARAAHDGDVAAVPEPASMLILGFGLAGMAVVRRKLG